MGQNNNPLWVAASIPQAIRVFISYSHDSAAHMDRVWELCDRLRRDGIDCRIDQHEESPAEGWTKWCKRQIKEAGFVLVVCTAIYEQRYEGDDTSAAGLGVKYEGFIINHALFEAGGRNTKFIPVYFFSEDRKYIPADLREFTYYDVNDASASDSKKLLLRLIGKKWRYPAPLGGTDYDELHRRLTDEGQRQPAHLSELEHLGRLTGQGQWQPSKIVTLPRRNIFLKRRFNWVAIIMLLAAGLILIWAFLPRQPAVQITEIPPLAEGRSEKTVPICGKVAGVKPDEFRVVLYAATDHWYVQPYTYGAFTGIDEQRKWCNVTHYGHSYAALLVRPGFQPLNVVDTLPQVDDNVVALTVVRGRQQ